MSWYVYAGVIIGIIILAVGFYYTLTQLNRVIHQAREDWDKGKSGGEVYTVDIDDLSFIKKEAVSNMYGAIIAGVVASFVISSYGWWWPFYFLGPLAALTAGVVLNWCFWTERKDCESEGRLA
tara:strand:+ start:302 stop:670 length:369 start_codon:yes stop_codon:yes gene_type:complete